MREREAVPNLDFIGGRALVMDCVLAVVIVFDLPLDGALPPLL